MAAIQIIYREGYCDLENRGFKTGNYCYQCHTCAAEAMGCKYFSHNKEIHIEAEMEDGLSIEIPYGDCVHATFEEKYKGVSVTKYEMERYVDACNPHLNCMNVKIGNRKYEAVNVKLDGKCIYDEEEE